MSSGAPLSPPIKLDYILLLLFRIYLNNHFIKKIKKVD